MLSLSLRQLQLHLADVPSPSLVDVAPTIASLLGITLEGVDGRRLPIAEGTRVDRVVLAIPDALGAWMLLDYLRHSEMRFFREAPVFQVVCSVLPPITPVAIASIATGCFPEHHGILTFSDTEVKRPTLLDAAKARGLKTATVAWSTSSVTRLLSRRADLAIICQNDAEVARHALRLIEEGEASLMIVHFLSLDCAAHKHGPLSAEARKAAEDIDRALLGMLQALRSRGGSFALIAVADHGQHPLPSGGGTHGAPTAYDMCVPLAAYIEG